MRDVESAEGRLNWAECEFHQLCRKSSGAFSVSFAVFACWKSVPPLSSAYWMNCCCSGTLPKLPAAMFSGLGLCLWWEAAFSLLAPNLTLSMKGIREFFFLVTYVIHKINQALAASPISESKLQATSVKFLAVLQLFDPEWAFPLSCNLLFDLDWETQHLIRHSCFISSGMEVGQLPYHLMPVRKTGVSGLSVGILFWFEHDRALRRMLASDREF